VAGTVQLKYCPFLLRSVVVSLAEPAGVGGAVVGVVVVVTVNVYTLKRVLPHPHAVRYLSYGDVASAASPLFCMISSHRAKESDRREEKTFPQV